MKNSLKSVEYQAVCMCMVMGTLEATTPTRVHLQWPRRHYRICQELATKTDLLCIHALIFVV